MIYRVRHLLTLPKIKVLLLGFSFLIIGSLIGFTISTQQLDSQASMTICPSAEDCENIPQPTQVFFPSPTSQPEVQGTNTESPTSIPTSSQPTPISQPTNSQPSPTQSPCN